MRLPGCSIEGTRRSIASCTRRGGFSRSKGTDVVQAQNDAHARTKTEQQRLTRELAAMEANQMFAQSAGCAFPKGRSARTFCATYAETKSALATANRQLTSVTPTNPHPQLTLLARLTGYDMASIEFSAALWPVLLAELLGSVGFYLSGRINAKDHQKTVERVSRLHRLGQRLRFKKPPESLPGASGAMSARPAAPVTAPSVQPALTWKIPKS